MTPEIGAVVVWLRDGSPEYGIVEGRDGSVAWCRRLDGPAHTHVRRFPKSPGDVVPIATADDLAAWLTARARQALAPPPS